MDGHANMLVPMSLIAWVPATFMFFLLLPGRRAVLISFLGGWMFLPVMTYKIPLIPDFGKSIVISMAVLGSVLMFDPGRLLRFRPHWYDLPMAALCLGPFFTSISNGLGPHDGLREALHESLYWGVPYFIGRLYFSEPAALRDLAVGLFVSGLIYMPLCLYEIRMSPMLNYIVYGFHQHSFFQHIRYNGYRPMVFMHHGLMVGLFMSAATLCGIWLWRSGALRSLFGIPLLLLIIPLAGTTILIKSVGAILLLFIGAAVLYSVRFFRSYGPVFALAIAPVIYVLVRATGVIPSADFVHTAADTLGAARAQSLESRLINEDMLTGRALERPILGWGGWGRARIYNEEGDDVTITDSLWIITLGNKGLLGLCALMTALILPAVLLTVRMPVGLWADPRAGGMVALAVVLLMFMVDCVLNAMINPLYLLAAGGLGGLAAVEIGEAEAAEPAPPPQEVRRALPRAVRIGQ